MIVCEIGLNHDGDSIYADEYLDVLLKYDIDALTFQVREQDFYKHKKKSGLLLTKNYYSQAKRKVAGANKKFGVALSDLTLLEFFESIDTDFYKILSKDANDIKYINKFMMGTNKNIFS